MFQAKLELCFEARPTGKALHGRIPTTSFLGQNWIAREGECSKRPPLPEFLVKRPAESESATSNVAMIEFSLACYASVTGRMEEAKERLRHAMTNYGLSGLVRRTGTDPSGVRET
jgi:hypothetical protein